MADSLYNVDEAALEAVREAKAWQNDPKYFRSIAISPAAAVKMLSHAVSGVEKGINSPGRKPVEIMGLMMGFPGVEDPHEIVVTDVFPLPIEGAETRVLADDQEVLNYMIELGESLEATRTERFCGWYHSHPFDVTTESHCFMSATDVGTQLQWQRAEEPHGNVWAAVVVDPLRSLAKGRPEFGAFRSYPPEYNGPAHETPDGKVIADEQARVERWGAAHNRYYALEQRYFMSSLGASMIGILSENFLWQRTLSSTPMLERENRERLSERIGTVAEKLDDSDARMGHGGGRVAYFGGRGGSGSSGAGGGAGGDQALVKAAQSSCELAIEQCQGQTTQIAKDLLFDRVDEEHEVPAAPPAAPAVGSAGSAAGAGAGSGSGLGSGEGAEEAKE